MGNTYLFSQILRIPMADLNKRRTSRYKPKLAWFSLAALFMLTFLLYAGGFTTSIGAGMVFPDWPLSDGSLNPEGWMQNRAMLAEHSHRLLGALMGLIIIVLTVWIWIEEERTWARNLAFAAFALVLLQGLLGGMRVLFDSLQFAIVHGCLAQAFLCLVVSIAAAQSSWWFEDGHGLPSRPNQRLKRGGLILCGMIFIQLIIGAIMRHKGAGLAIPTFPLTPEGSLLPQHWDFGIILHFAHRLLALVIFVAYCIWAFPLILSAKIDARIRLLGGVGLALLASQIVLGAYIIWTFRNPFITTAHVLVGAFLLANSWIITFFQFQPSRPAQVDATPRVPTGTGVGEAPSNLPIP